MIRNATIFHHILENGPGTVAAVLGRPDFMIGLTALLRYKECHARNRS